MSLNLFFSEDVRFAGASCQFHVPALTTIVANTTNNHLQEDLLLSPLFWLITELNVFFPEHFTNL